MYIIGNKIIELNEINSTNDFASSLLSKDKQPEGTIVLAKYQTNGKGQGNNTWYSSKNKNLLLSIILFPEFLNASKQFYLSEISTLAILKTIKEYLNLNCKIKWPNDIYFKNMKIGGVLIRNSLKGHIIKNSVIGIGLNVNQMKFPKQLSNASSLALILEKKTDKNELFYNLLQNLDDYYIKLKNGDFDNIKQKFVTSLLGYDTILKFQANDGHIFYAKILTVKETGELVLDINGDIKTFSHGEIKFIST